MQLNLLRVNPIKIGFHKWIMMLIISWLFYPLHLELEKVHLQKILQKYKSFKLSVSSTTRLPRSNEVDGVDYHFTTELEELIKKTNFMNTQKFLVIIMGHKKRMYQIIQ